MGLTVLKDETPTKNMERFWTWRLEVHILRVRVVSDGRAKHAERREMSWQLYC